MAAKKEIKTTIERTYNIPLRKEFLKVPHWKKTKKAVAALRKFLVKHMKSTEVKISKELNEELWKQGIKNPPHHVKVTVTKNSEGIVNADLFGKKEKSIKKTVKETKKQTKKELPIETKTEKPLESATETAE